VFGFFLITMSLMAEGVVKFRAFPELDGDVIVVRVLLPPGTPLTRTEQVVEKLTAAVRRVNQHFAPRQPSGQDLIRAVVAQFNENTDAFENGPHVATVTADLLEAEVRDASIDEIDVQLRPADQNTLADFETFYFTGANGQQIPLASVAEVWQDRGWSRIARVDGLRTVTVRGGVDTRKANTADLLGRLKRDFLPELQQRHAELRFAVEGESKEAATTQRSMMQAMLIGLLGVFAILSFQFRSYLEPLAVMVAIPLALIGVIWGHLLMGVDFSMPSMLGYASLAGIVVNDSILLVLLGMGDGDRRGKQALAVDVGEPCFAIAPSCGGDQA